MNMRDVEFQKELLKKTETPSKALEIAICIETGIQNQLNKISEDSSMVSIVWRSGPVCLVNISTKGTFRQNWQGKKPIVALAKIVDLNGLPNIVTNVQQPVMFVKRVGKNHFVRLCRSKQTDYKAGMKTSYRSVNNVKENETELVHTLDVNSSYTYSDEDYYVNMVSEGDDSTINSADENGDPKYLFVKFGISKYNIMVDTVSVVSLITKTESSGNCIK